MTYTRMSVSIFYENNDCQIAAGQKLRRQFRVDERQIDCWRAEIRLREKLEVIKFVIWLFDMQYVMRNIDHRLHIETKFYFEETAFNEI